MGIDIHINLGIDIDIDRDIAYITIRNVIYVIIISCDGSRCSNFAKCYCLIMYDLCHDCTNTLCYWTDCWNNRVHK